MSQRFNRKKNKGIMFGNPSSFQWDIFQAKALEEVERLTYLNNAVQIDQDVYVSMRIASAKKPFLRLFFDLCFWVTKRLTPKVEKEAKRALRQSKHRKCVEQWLNHEDVKRVLEKTGETKKDKLEIAKLVVLNLKPLLTVSHTALPRDPKLIAMIAVVFAEKEQGG